MNNTIGIDISKDTLDVHRLAGGQHKQFSNGKTIHTQLIKWIGIQSDLLVIFEATGAYHRPLERVLGTQLIPFVKVNPKQARRFAQASGKLAKTDRVDCEMLAKMGAALQLVPKPIAAKSLYDLRELLSARRALIKDRTAAKARSATVTHALLKQQLAKRLRHIECDIAKIDAVMLALAHKDQQMSERLEILSSIPGIGIRTALMILVDMPEIGTLDSKQVTSLAGLAPMSQSSGKWQGKARIQGGHPNLRHAIFMPALVAIRHNVDFKGKYEQLVAAGKEKKSPSQPSCERCLSSQMSCYAIIENGLKKQLDQDGYSHAPTGVLYEDGCSISRRPRAAQTTDHHAPSRDITSRYPVRQWMLLDPSVQCRKPDTQI